MQDNSTMRNALRKFAGTAAAGLLLVAGGPAFAADKAEDSGGAPAGVNVGGGERGIEAYIIDGPPIAATAVASSKHRSFARGMVCVECHKIDFPVDATATATKQIAASARQLSQEEIWDMIVKFLPGRERFALTTTDGDQPLATTVDMVLDKEEKVLYVVSEVGTEKLNQLRRNPKMSAVRFQGWTVAERGKQEWRSTQIKGTAEVIPASDARFLPLLNKYQLVRLTPERAVRRFDLIRITPQQIWYFDTELSGEPNASVYQLWKRGATGVLPAATVAN
jgi:nitroimidazol reductase NimA-like FMN-containing flavoprotein (pyridoxamine 5'-phosphate oxidase superfamily)